MISPAPLRRSRLHLDIEGAVQGVGFRPHVHRLARELGLTGWVLNDGQGVQVEVEGPPELLRLFQERLRQDPPARAVITEMDGHWQVAEGSTEFLIRVSAERGTPTVFVLPDLAVCEACLADIRKNGGRRRDYAFTNCTECGPRLSIVRKLPYDRPHTTMAGFALCDACEDEYGDPTDRRFHAQPNACPACGPHLGWWDGLGKPLLGVGTEGGGSAEADESIVDAAAAALREGRIVAVKGLGGFHLLADAASEKTVRRLRRRKHREAKPLALMVRDVEEARRLADVDEASATLLRSPEAPILLLPALPDAPLAPSVAPGNPRIGLMLPCTPLHVLLLEAFGGPVVATSGNRSDEPIATGNDQAVDRLRGVADHFLVHDRPIQRPVEDSVVGMNGGAPQFIRRARGYAPLPVPLADEVASLLAVGGHLKNTVAVSRGRNVFVSSHVGDLEAPEARDAFRQAVADFLELYRIEPRAVVHDSHPDYASTRWACDEGPRDVPRIAVQHHHAHLASVLAENGVPPDHDPVLGIIWDGTGFGPDGTVWGGEFMVGGYLEAPRAARIRPFPLPGGERAVREPRRAALGILHSSGMDIHAAGDFTRTAFSPEERRVLNRAVDHDLNAPLTSSAGRLFDALASLLGLCQYARFEGEAAMLLEFAADPHERGTYLMSYREPDWESHGPAILDWEPMVEAALADQLQGVPVTTIAARIHNGLVDAMVRTAEMAGLETVALSGGCFLNHRLLAHAVRALGQRGHRVLVNRRVPPGDGGLALGQVAVAGARLQAGPRITPELAVPSTSH